MFPDICGRTACGITGWYSICRRIPEPLENTEPDGTPGIGTNGKTGYFGPCPPDREHRYFFKVFALDTRLDLPEKSTKANVENALAGHVLFHAELMGTYERNS
jgi:hypothetical protein